jgi:thiol:disulfide interchange protein DsbD
MKKMVQWLGGVMLMLCMSVVQAADPLRPEQAFQVTATVNAANQVITEWKVAPGYYLYVNKLKFDFEPSVRYQAEMPPSVSKTDPLTGGAIAVYANDVTIPLSVDARVAALRLTISYQGCSSEGFCYPPTKKSFDLSFNASLNPPGVTNDIVTNQSISALLTDQYGIQTLLAYEHRGLLLLIFLGLGILLAFTPCVLPMLPILTGIIAGQRQSSTTRRAFFLSLCYVLGMAITYACAGMLAAYAGGSLQVLLQKPIVIVGSSLIFVLLAFSLFEFFELPVSRRWQNAVTSWSGRHEGGTFVGVFLMGILSTLVVSPCVTAPLVGVLLYISRTGDMVLGGSALFVMGLGMGIPLMLLGVSAGRWMPKSGMWMHAVTKSFGVIMLGMALWLVSRIIPMHVMMVMWGLYLLGIALYFSLYLTRVIGRHKINHTLGFMTGVAGLLMILSTIGLPSLIGRWTNDVTVNAATMATNFVEVHGRDELNEQLAKAKAAGEPVLVDFYANWCTSCVAMENEVFARANVQAALQPFMLIRVDLSENTPEDQALLKEYQVIAPPTVLFFSATGQEVNTRRIVGEMDAKDFLNRLNLFMAASCDRKAQC